MPIAPVELMVVVGPLAWCFSNGAKRDRPLVRLTVAHAILVRTGWVCHYADLREFWKEARRFFNRQVLREKIRKYEDTSDET